MVMVDRDGRIALVNAETERLFGYSREALIGQSIDLLVPERYRREHRAHRAHFHLQPERRAMGTGRDLYAAHKDGSEFPVEIALNPLDTPSGPMVLASIVDITERKAAAQRIERYARMLERSNEELQHFAYVVSHDLKAPLRGIAAVAEWLAEDFASVVDEDARQSIALMLERTERMTRLIDGILQYSRAGSEGLDKTTVDSHDLAADVIASLPVPHEIEIVLMGRLPLVTYDQTQLRQVFQNLIFNAVQHMGVEHGTVTVACRRDGQHWVFSVADTGVGISERHRERIFKLFEVFRTKDTERARGLGLPIAKRIVEHNGGAIGLADRSEPGCEFFFTVPVDPLP
jgi:PAS domain S-box-containing protein